MLVTVLQTRFLVRMCYKPIQGVEVNFLLVHFIWGATGRGAEELNIQLLSHVDDGCTLKGAWHNSRAVSTPLPAWLPVLTRAVRCRVARPLIRPAAAWLIAWLVYSPTLAKWYCCRQSDAQRLLARVAWVSRAKFSLCLHPKIALLNPIGGEIPHDFPSLWSSFLHLRQLSVIFCR